MKNKLRRVLGAYKKYLIDTLPYLSLHKKVPTYRENLSNFVRKLPITTGNPEQPDIEAHMLCGKRDIDMGITAGWSLLRFAGIKSVLYVHSDGSLNQEDETYWKKVIPNTTFIQRETSDATVAEKLKDKTTHLYNWRCKNWASAQLVDMHFFGDSPSLLIMDSDVIVLHEPQELFETLNTNPAVFAWCKDHLDAYSAPITTIKEITGKTIPQALCAGVLVSPRQTVESLIELDHDIDKIDKDPRVETNHFWSCQTYYALLATKAPGSKTLSQKYNNRNGRTKDEPLRHYVGVPKIRFRYFTEGVPILAKQLGFSYNPSLK